VLFKQNINAQNNLVVNGGFEDTIAFIPGLVVLQSMIPPWYNYQLTPDYYSLVYSFAKVYSFDSIIGYSAVAPHEGNGFVGMFMAIRETGAQEYMGGELSKNLIAGRRYCTKFFLKRGVPIFGAPPYASDGFGIYFSKDTIDSAACCTPPYSPQIRNPYGNVIYDTTWIAMEGSFIAEGGERFFIVGNFKDADETVFDPASQYADTYYFFDDFSVWYCDSTTITEVEIDPMLPHQHLPPDTVETPELPLIIPNLLSVYGNSTWQIGNLPPNTEVTLFNALGQLVYHSVNYANNLNAAGLAAGMYFYEVTPALSEKRKGKLVVIR
jgi:hypothetical protein